MDYQLFALSFQPTFLYLSYELAIHGKPHFLFPAVLKRWSFQKKSRWNMIFLVLSGKMIFLFPENMILPLRRKMKYDLSQKIHGTMIFFSNVLRRWSFQKGLRSDMSFLALSEKMVFFARKQDIFSLGGK